jgi:hypothetical protein
MGWERQQVLSLYILEKTPIDRSSKVAYRSRSAAPDLLHQFENYTIVFVVLCCTRLLRDQLSQLNKEVRKWVEVEAMALMLSHEQQPLDP